MSIEITAAERQAEQGLMHAIRETVATIERIKQERDMYRDALAKICFIERTECGASKALEIARRSLNV